MTRPLARLALVIASLAALEVVFRLAGLGTLEERAGLLERVEGWQAPDDDAPAADGSPSAIQVLDPALGFTTERIVRRLAEQADQFEQATYDVLVLGGSVAVGLATMGDADLAATLAAEADLAEREVRVINLGRGGFKQPQQLHLLSQALNHGWAPDAVVNLDGFNELALGVQNALDYGVHPFWPSFTSMAPLMVDSAGSPRLREALVELELARRRSSSLGGPLPLGLHHSALVRSLATARLRSAVGDYERARDAYLAALQASGEVPISPPFEPGLEAALELCVRNWLECSRSMHGICAERGIAYLHVLQPTLHDEGSKPLTPEEVEAGKLGPELWARAAREGYPLLREAGARLTALGVPFFDASDVFVDDRRTLYEDICHFGGPGNYVLGEAIGRALADSLALER